MCCTGFLSAEMVHVSVETMLTGERQKNVMLQIKIKEKYMTHLISHVLVM